LKIQKRSICLARLQHTSMVDYSSFICSLEMKLIGKRYLMTDIAILKRENSTAKTTELTQALKNLSELNAFEQLTVFVTGSYARKEASQFSDIDLFFLLDCNLANVSSPNTKRLRLFSKIIEIADGMKFPAFSNDGQFLDILEYPNMEEELGGINDDHSNYFTARMLMLLESNPVFGEATYEKILTNIVQAYFRDYKHHPENFLPIFLINDILRFWKTLCLNYENKRNQPDAQHERKIKQKIKNFKLKFSRMLTCFGSITAIIEMGADADVKQIVALRQDTPLERLTNVANKYKALKDDIEKVQREYNWFLEVTNVSEAALIDKFRDEIFKTDAFSRADEFGMSVYKIVRYVAEEKEYMRYLLI